VKRDEKSKSSGLTRRDALKATGLALGGLGAGMSGGGCIPPLPVGDCYPTLRKTDQYSYFESLKTITPWKLNGLRQVTGTKLCADEMRITFLGTMIPPARRAQLEMSIFVEVGWDESTQQPLDQFVFDCGCGVCGNYGAMGIAYPRMDKVFLCHLHGDHMADLLHIYCFGAAQGRFTPLYVWGPGPSNLVWTEPEDITVTPPPTPNTYGPYDDGLNVYCNHLRQASRWHSESFSFLNTGYPGYTPPTQSDWNLPVAPVPIGGDTPTDGYTMIPVELDWTKTGLDANGIPTGDNIAYWNKKTGVKITHFPVIHCRKGSIGYKLEWTNPNVTGAPTLTMIYTSDTRPENVSIQQAINKNENGEAKGVDVFIHEMVIPPSVWAFKNMGLSAPPPSTGDTVVYQTYLAATQQAQMVQNSSHTPQGAYGYLLSQITPRPRLAVATHFPVADDTVECAFKSVVEQNATFQGPNLGKLGEKVTWSYDGMVIRVRESCIQQLRAVTDDWGWSPVYNVPGTLAPPKYWQYEVDSDGNIVYKDGQPVKVGNPLAQIDYQDVIPPTGDDGEYHYRSDGY